MKALAIAIVFVGGFAAIAYVATSSNHETTVQITACIAAGGEWGGGRWGDCHHRPDPEGVKP